MQKEKVRIFALARELDMESKDLLTICRQHGIDVKNQLSTIEPELCDQIKVLVKKGGGTATAAPTKAPVLPQVDKKILNLDARRPRPAAATPPRESSQPEWPPSSCSLRQSNGTMSGAFDSVALSRMDGIAENGSAIHLLRVSH